MRRLLRWGAWALGAPVAVLAVYGGAFLADSALHYERVQRNVTVDGVFVGGLDRPSLDRYLDELATEAAVRPVVLDGGDRVIEATLADLGVRLDVAAIRGDVLGAGDHGSFVDDIAGWWQSFGESRNVGVRFVIDPGVAETFLAAQPNLRPYEPVEPTYSGIFGELIVMPGGDGLALDIAGAVAAVESLAGNGYPAASRTIEWKPVPTQIDDAALADSLAAAEAMAVDVKVVVNGRSATIGRGTVRRWIESEFTANGLVPRFDHERAEASVMRLLSSFIDPGTPPTFTVVDGEVITELGEEPMRCCEPGFGADLEAWVKNDRQLSLILQPTPVYDDGGAAAVAELGINELVAEFTTNHGCCASRVDNIHRIADLVRGVVLDTGGRFSINEFIGMRTREKGFVAAGVIESGHFVDDVGGGISQFATTMFNAAFFAGLDFEAYQSHSIYLSRYPYGREATLSFPEPDLIVTNPTPYAMLIWTDYTDTSITVQLYSTPHFEVEQTRQSTFRWGKACRRVNTYRTRTAPDGEVLEDFVFATYRPGEGRDCNGNPTPKPKI
jgi:vancomycin resistance protein YoaR